MRKTEDETKLLVGTFMMSLRHSEGDVGSMELDGAGVGPAVGSGVGSELIVGSGVGSAAVHWQAHCCEVNLEWYVNQDPVQLGGRGGEICSVELRDAWPMRKAHLAYA